MIKSLISDTTMIQDSVFVDINLKSYLYVDEIDITFKFLQPFRIDVKELKFSEESFTVIKYPEHIRDMLSELGFDDLTSEVSDEEALKRISARVLKEGTVHFEVAMDNLLIMSSLLSFYWRVKDGHDKICPAFVAMTEYVKYLDDTSDVPAFLTPMRSEQQQLVDSNFSIRLSMLMNHHVDDF
jgi:hypothetical protein